MHKTDNPIIRVQDVAFCRVRAPDLDAVEAFLTDFGMVRAARTDHALYLRGTGAQHHIHVVERGEPGVIGAAFLASSRDDLERLARLAPGASAVEEIDEPGGGWRVRLTEPNGYQIEVIHGMQAVAPIVVPPRHINTVDEPRRRVGEAMRLRKGPAHIHRMGHFVIVTPQCNATVRWFRETLGMIGTDDFYRGTQDNLVASFNRCDRGDDYADHHTVYCRQSERTGIHHLSYEATDLDDVFLGHDHMVERGHRHVWGVSRHLYGSQVTDYWADPTGALYEFWTDTDRFNRANGTQLTNIEDRNFTDQWGTDVPEEFPHWVY